MNTGNNKFPDIQDVDINDWCKKLDCTEAQLRYCIERVGTSWISVEAFWSMIAPRIRKTVPEK